MANIDASTISAHSYLNVFKNDANQDNDFDIFNKKTIEENFIKAACLVDPKQYAKILILETTWANINFKANIEEHFQKDKEYLNFFNGVQENYNQKQKKKKMFF